MAQAKLIEKLDVFLDVLDKSKLFSPEQIEKLRKELAGSEKQPLEIARMLVTNRKLTKWQAGQLLSGYHKFRQGQFVLRDQLGKSRLGGLFAAHDEKRKQLVALRSLSKAATANPDAVARFVSAAQAAIALEHENVARVLEVNSEAQRHLIVTEYVSGRDLRKLVEEDGPLSATLALTYLRQAADALRLAHKKQLVHGSLHPACLLVDPNGLVKIADWGLAPLRDGVSGFSAPDQRGDQPADVGTDIFLLGGTLYYLLTGRAPYSGSTPEEEKAIAKSGRPISLNKLRQDIPDSLVALCEQLMAADPAERPQSIKDVLSQISQIGEAGEAGDVDDVDDVVELEAEEPVELDDATDAVEPIKGADEATGKATKATGKAGPAAGKKATADALPNVTLGDANKTAPISDTAAFAISTGKAAAAGPVGDFKISMKKKTKTKGAAKEKPAAAPAEAEAPSRPARPSRPASGAASKQEPSRAGAEAPDSDAPEAAEPASEAPTGKKKKKKSGVPVGLIVGLAALFGLTLLGGGALLAFLLLRGGDEVVAQAGDGTEGAQEATIDPEASDPEIDPEDVPDEIELVEDDPPGADPSEATGDQGDATPDAGTAAADPPGPDTPADDGATPAPEAPPATPGAETTDPESGDPKPDGADPTAQPAEDPETKKPAEEDDAKKRADDEAAAKLKAEQEAAAKKQAEEKKLEDEKKKKAAAGPVFVFKPTIDLPELPAAGAAGSPLMLGKINIKPTDVCFISMTGGDSASRGRAEFMIRNAKSGTAPRDWEFVVREDSAETVIATLALPEKDLLFQWLPAAADNVNAGNLRNCTLKITAGVEKPQVLALRSPVGDESVPIDLTKATMQARWDLDSPPDPGALQVLASVKGHKIVLDPPQPISAAKGTQWIFLGENKDASVLALKLDSTVSARGVQVTLKPFLTIPGEKPLAYNKATKKRVTQQLSQRPQLEAKVKFFQEGLKKAPPAQKQQVQIALTQAEQGLQVFDKMAQQLSQLDQIEQSYNGAVLDFQVLYRTLQGEMVLVQTSAGGGGAP